MRILAIDERDAAGSANQPHGGADISISERKSDSASGIR
jgi:hypothetical protein